MHWCMIQMDCKIPVYSHQDVDVSECTTMPMTLRFRTANLVDLIRPRVRDAWDEDNFIGPDLETH